MQYFLGLVWIKHSLLHLPFASPLIRCQSVGLCEIDKSFWPGGNSSSSCKWEEPDEPDLVWPWTDCFIKPPGSITHYLGTLWVMVAFGMEWCLWWQPTEINTVQLKATHANTLWVPVHNVDVEMHSADVKQVSQYWKEILAQDSNVCVAL